MINQIANATERTIRYLIPGIWIYILCLATKSNGLLFVAEYKPEIMPLSVSILFGVIVFVIYRLIFDLIEYMFINCCDIKKLKDSFDFQKEPDENYRNYIFLKFAFVHMAFLLPVISFIAAYVTKESQTFFSISKTSFVILNLLLFIVGVGNYIFLYKIVNYREPEG